MKKVVLIALAVSVLVLAALPGCGDEIPSGAIVKVNDGSVSKADFDKFMDQAKAQATLQPGAPPFPSPGTPAYNQATAQLVDYLVQQELIRQEAEKLKISVSDDEINTRLEEIYKQYGGEAKVAKLLEQQNMTKDELLDFLKTNLLTEKLQAEKAKDAKPTDEELKAYFDQNEAMFSQPEQRTLRHILVKDKATAETVYKELKADPSAANWKALAKKYSTDESNKDKGGALGAVSPGMMPPPFDKAAFAAKKGEVVGPVKTDLGWHVLEATAITAAKKQSFEEVKEQISQMLSSQASATAWQDWLKKAKDEAKIKYGPGFDPAKLTAPASPAQQPTTPPSPKPKPSKTTK